MAGITVKDVTQQVLAEFNNNVPDGKPPGEAQRKILLPNNNEWPLPAWDLPLHSNYLYFDDPPVDERTGELRFVRRTLRPRTMEFVFEIGGITTPKLIAVSWPDALAPRRNVPVPYLVYYRPEPIPGNNRFGPDYIEICHRRESPPKRGCAIHNLKSYPLNWDFLFYVLWNYLNYRSDPLTYLDERWRLGRAHMELNRLPLRETDVKFSFGLPYQIEAAGKPLVLILPMASAGTFGDFQKPAVVQETLEAIQSFIFRSAGVEPAPPLEWVALAGFSKSNKTVGHFLTNNRDHPLVAKTIKEVYLFDPAPVNEDEVNTALHNVMVWASRGTVFKAIRAYGSQRQFPAYQEILGRPLPQRAGFRNTRLGVQLGNTNRFQEFPWSVAWLPAGAWVKAQEAARKDYYARTQQQYLAEMTNAQTLEQGQNAFNKKWALDDQKEYDKENKIGAPNSDVSRDVHLALAATCLTDAVRRNGFNYTPYNIPGRRFAGVNAPAARRVLAGIRQG